MARVRAQLTTNVPGRHALAHVVVHTSGQVHGSTTAHKTGYSNTAEAFVAISVCSPCFNCAYVSCNLVSCQSARLPIVLV